MIYKFEKLDVDSFFSKTMDFLLEGRVSEAIESYYAALRKNESFIHQKLYSIYQLKLDILSSEYFQINELWKSKSISTKERFEEQDRFIYRLYESIVELKFILSEINNYKFKFKNVSIRIDREFDKFDAGGIDSISQEISNLLGIDKSEFKVKSLDRGSVIMTLEFEDSVQAENLYLLIKLGKLKKAGVSEARLKELSERVSLHDEKESALSKICRESKMEIQNGQTDKALEFLIASFKNVPFEYHNETLLLSSELKEIRRRESLGIEAFEKISIVRNRITFSVLELIDRINKKIA